MQCLKRFSVKLTARCLWLFALLLILPSHFLQADSLALLKDINQTVNRSKLWQPQNGFYHAGKIYFAATDGIYGAEPWVYDTDTQSSTLLFDIETGTGDSSPDGFIVFDGKIFFSANRSDIGEELWTYDPAKDKTSLIKNIAENETSSRPRNFVVYNDALYFIAYREDVGDEVFVLLKGANEPILLADVNPGSISSGASDLVVYDDNLFLGANSGDNSGHELHVIDPVTGHVELVADIYTEDNSSNVNNLHVYDDKLYVSATDERGEELWCYDSFTGQVSLIADINDSGSSSPDDFVTVGGTLYFSAYSSASGRELFSYNDIDKLSQVTEISNGIDSSFPSDLIVANNAIYFSAETSDSGRELWRHVPSDSSTELVVDIIEGSLSGAPKNLMSDGELVYFFANDGEVDAIWQLDPQTNISIAVNNGRIGTFGSSPTDLFVYQGEVYFRAEDQRYGHELHIYDPGSEEVGLFADIRSGENSSLAKEFVEHNGVLYFSANDGTQKELFKFSAELGDVYLALDINPSGSSDPRELYSYQGMLYFTAQSADSNRLLYQYDDAADQLTIIDLPLNRNDVEIEQIVGFNGDIYVSALVDTDLIHDEDECDPRELECNDEDDIPPWEREELFEISERDKVLWKIDPNTATAEMAFDLEHGLPVDPYYFVVLDDSLYFTAEVDMGGQYLLSLDTNGELTKYQDEYSDDTSYNGLFVFQDKLVMGKSTPEIGLELWQLNPVDNSFQLISDINFGEGDSYPWQFLAFNDVLYFNAYTPELGEELWSYDGQTVKLVADIRLGEDSSQPKDLVVIDDSLIFVAEDHNYGREVWRYIPDLPPTFLNPPVGTLQLPEDTTTEQINLTLHAFDKNGGLINWTISTPQNGVAYIGESITNSKQIYYQSNQDFNGFDSFVVTITDEIGLSSEFQVSVEVTPVNDAPNGSISYEGNAIDGEVVTIKTDFVDVDGFERLSFQWLDGSSKVLSSEQSYQLGQDDVAKIITGSVFYTDLGGTEEKLFTTAFVVDYKKDSDYDLDGLTNEFEVNLGTSMWLADSDFDNVNDAQDAFPLNIKETKDTDRDGVGDNSDEDIDGDGVINDNDAYPYNYIDSDYDLNGNGEDDLTEVFDRLNGQVITSFATAHLTNVKALVNARVNEALNSLRLEAIYLINIYEGYEHYSGTSNLTLQVGSDLRYVDTILELNLYPQVFVPAERAVKAGNDLMILIQLSGEPISYPVEVHYQIKSLNTETVISTSLVSFEDGDIAVQVVEPGLPEGDFELVLIEVTLGNASLEVMNTKTFITVRERVAPSVEVNVYDGDIVTSLLEKSDTEAYLNFALTGGMEDIINAQVLINEEVFFDDTATELSSISLDLESLAIGTHEVKTILTSTDINETYEVVDTMYFSLQQTLQELKAEMDSDNDGVSDREEGYGDSDGDGIADYLDDANLSANEQLLGEAKVTVSEGLTIAIGSVLQQVDEGLSQDIGTSVDEIEESLGIEIDDLDITGYVLPVLDFEIRGAEIGAAVDMIIPLQNTLVGTEEYRKLSEDGQLIEFDITDGSRVSSGMQVAGECPAINNVNEWQSGFVKGNDCIKLTIIDGGTNDADGEANGTIIDPAVLVNVNRAPEVNLVSYMEVEELTEVKVSAHVTDEDDQTLIYLWQELSDLKVALINNNTSEVTFTAPNVSHDGDIVELQLSVSDGVDTVTSRIKILVDNLNQIPSLSVTQNTNAVNEGMPLVLTIESTDSDNDDLSISITQVQGPQTLSISTPPLNGMLVIDAPQVSQTENYSFEIKLTDGIDTTIQSINFSVINQVATENNVEDIKVSVSGGTTSLGLLMLFYMLLFLRMLKQR